MGFGRSLRNSRPSPLKRFDWLRSFQLQVCPVTQSGSTHFVGRPDDMLSMHRRVIRRKYFRRYVSGNAVVIAHILLSVLSGALLGQAVDFLRRIALLIPRVLLYRQALILVPPNHSMQRKIDPELRLATPSLSSASISADFNVRRRR